MMTTRRNNGTSRDFWFLDEFRFRLPGKLLLECVNLVHNKELTHQELSFMVQHLGMEDMFRQWWNIDAPRTDQGELVPDETQDHTYDGWRTRQGDNAWRIGNLEKADSWYRDSILYPDSCLSGWGGLFRLYFYKRNFPKCAEIFEKICPSKIFFEKHLEEWEQIEDGRMCVNDITDSPAETSPYFISDAKYMLQIVVYVLSNTNAISDDISIRILGYFARHEVKYDDLFTMASEYYDNSSEFERLRKRVIPTPLPASAQAFPETGDTPRAKQLCQQILASPHTKDVLWDYLLPWIKENGPFPLDAIYTEGMFGLSQLDRLLIEEAFVDHFPWDASLGYSQEIMIRRQYPYFTYGKQRISGYDWIGWWHESYGQFFRSGQELRPVDILIGMCQVNWWKRKNFVDMKFMEQNFQWCTPFLESYIVENASPGTFESISSAERFLVGAYRYTCSQYEEAQEDERWISEAKLFAVIDKLFSDFLVERHSQPIWLSPQHLDIYIPELGLAIEYMGKQHFEPVKIFGGEQGYLATVERDKRKRQLCKNAEVNLEYVSYTDKIGDRATQIHQKYAR